MWGDPNVNNGYWVSLSPSAYPVSPGDEITASVSLSGSTWLLAITDTTKAWTSQTPVASPTPAPGQSSAEWIAERPQVGGSLTPLTDFGAVTFTGAMADGNGQTGPISAFSWSAVQMVGSTTLAAPGSLDPTGENFTDTWHAAS